ncbi:putative quinol monooxygenase [uncultured Ruminococcus sp.]|uniref:putative quinol monooxygenase n=1 Tax=uncultured Ruminococcus sp. TaxID=165186 RepID=UPI002639CAA7|nr:putative quinol monooxygenase [uncultured Ruminococcus sp.]
MKQFVEVHYYVKDGKRDEFYHTILERGIADASRAEEGNEKYDYYLSPDNENELLLIELWASTEAVQEHGQTAHFKELGELKQEYVTDTIIRRYDIAED